MRQSRCGKDGDAFPAIAGRYMSRALIPVAWERDPGAGGVRAGPGAPSRHRAGADRPAAPPRRHTSRSTCPKRRSSVTPSMNYGASRPPPRLGPLRPSPPASGVR